MFPFPYIFYGPSFINIGHKDKDSLREKAKNVLRFMTNQQKKKTTYSLNQVVLMHVFTLESYWSGEQLITNQISFFFHSKG